jgi:glycosyltransferase involved in cell wall biosynthesis
MKSLEIRGALLLDLSILVPVFNEVENVAALYQEIDATLRDSGKSYEVIFIDDGSTDGTARTLHALALHDPDHVRVLTLRRNGGQTAALSAGIDHARGRILIPMDGDRQNDPADIPRLLSRLEEGYDVVSGWRKDRKDRFLSRRLPSRIANHLVAKLSGVPLHDFGCTLKAYRREVLAGVRLYGELHRFIPIFAFWQGAKVTELVVNHRPRTAGKTKYGLGRTFRVVLDLILIRFLQRYAQRPMHFFGKVALWSFAFSVLCFIGMIYFKYLFPWPLPLSPQIWRPKSFVETPLPLLVVMFVLSGVQSILMGLLAEMIMRTYYESQSKPTYLIGAVEPAETASPPIPAAGDREWPSTIVPPEWSEESAPIPADHASE